MSKRVLITGGNKGIGLAVSRAMLEFGYEVIIVARDFDTCPIVGVANVTAIEYDLSNVEDLPAIAKEVGNIDILINNAGDYVYGGIEEMDYEKISRIFTTNLLTPTYLCSIAAKTMQEKKWGRIINIGSISGVMGEAYASLYSGSKAGLIGLTKALALELAQYEITVNTVNPGWVETKMGLKSIEESDFTNEETLETIPQKRFVDPKEIERLINYLISEDAKGITGQSINLCAGLSLGC